MLPWMNISTPTNTSVPLCLYVYETSSEARWPAARRGLFTVYLYSSKFEPSELITTPKKKKTGKKICE